MKIIKGDIWEVAQRSDNICIPTNLDVTGNGKGVMGKGLAKQAVVKDPTCIDVLGLHNRHRPSGAVDVIGMTETGQYIIAFPTKIHWRRNSTLGLINKSAKQLKREINNSRLGNGKYFLPKVGCGLGGLTWEEVEPILDKHLNDLDNVFIVDYER